jgi:murein L,D-transpeptidase YcbB/YkuD
MRFSLRTTIFAAGLAVAAAGAGVNHAYISSRPAADHAADGDLHGVSSGLHLVLNVAGNRLHVYENGERTKTYKVSVGKQGHETPPGEYRIRQVIWNPWWHPPNSAWARGRKPAPPGPDNPMGRVKLNFAPLLYIHGTEEWQSLGSPASHGCVRMRNDELIELTRLVHRYASPSVSSGLIDELVASPRSTRTIRLATPVRFTANYDVAAVENGFLIIYPDVYGLRKQQVRDEVEAVLEDSGIDPRSVHAPTLSRLVEKSGSRRVAIAIDDLRSGVAGVSVGDADGR